MFLMRKAHPCWSLLSKQAFVIICWDRFQLNFRIFTISLAFTPLVIVLRKLWCCLMTESRFWWPVWLNATSCQSSPGCPRWVGDCFGSESTMSHSIFVQLPEVSLRSFFFVLHDLHVILPRGLLSQDAGLDMPRQSQRFRSLHVCHHSCKRTSALSFISTMVSLFFSVLSQDKLDELYLWKLVSLKYSLHTLQLLASKLALDRSLSVPKDGRVGIQLQSISAAHFFHLQKFLRKFETEIVDGSKTEPWSKLVVQGYTTQQLNHASHRLEWDDKVTQTILAPHWESSDRCEFDWVWLVWVQDTAFEVRKDAD